MRQNKEKLVTTLAEALNWLELVRNYAPKRTHESINEFLIYNGRLKNYLDVSVKPNDNLLHIMLEEAFMAGEQCGCRPSAPSMKLWIENKEYLQ